MKSNQLESPVTFAELGLPAALLDAVNSLGYEQPSPIQAEAIPPLLEGRDLLGQAQTGTGKTAAFALPLLSKIDTKSHHPQLLVLTPTRELAIQVAEACQQYARNLKGLHVLPIYGGQSYTIQLKQLKRGAHVIVGTPGRVMDHMRRGTLSLSKLNALVLDEADEMLRMGFIDDVKWVLQETPPKRQIALFSATMPTQIKKVADKYLNKPVHIKIQGKTSTATNISQRYWMVRGTNKLDAITRILESEDTSAVLVFVRTKNATLELADKLSARGFRSEALNGDIPQNNREKVIDRLRKGKLDILVATDVVARGLDVERISHVINYDVPHDIESYVHRIGRTGRAGRDGSAILFITPREKRMLFAIERSTKQPITPMDLPSVQDINRTRAERFKEKLLETIKSADLDLFSQIVTEMQHEHEISSEQIAAAAAFLAQGDNPLQIEPGKEQPEKGRHDRGDSGYKGDRGDRGDRGDPRRSKHHSKPTPSRNATPLKEFPDVAMQRFRLDVGRNDGVKPSNIVGAIANEAELASSYIGEIEIRDDYSTVDLPADMPKGILAILKKVRVGGKPMGISIYTGDEPNPDAEYKPRKKSYTSKKRDRGEGGKKGISEYASKKRKARGKKK